MNAAAEWMLETDAQDLDSAERNGRNVRVREEGRRLLLLLAGLVRACRLYGKGNDALLAPAEELAEIVAGMVDAWGVVRVAFVNGQVYVNDTRIGVRPAQQDLLAQFDAELERHQCGGFAFHQGLKASAVEEVARVLAGPASGPLPAVALRSRLEKVGGFEVFGPWRFGQDDDDPARLSSYADVLAQTEATLGSELSRLASGFMPSALPLRRAVISVIQTGGTEAARAALAPFAGPQAGTERHLVAVCQLSLMLGAAIGLDESALCDLGVTALLHDVGYLISRDSSRHPIAGVRVLLRQRGFSEAKVRRLRAVIEHASAVGTEPGEPSSLFARILQVSEHYDVLVAPRAREAPACSPARALARMWAGRGTRYDPTLLSVFVRQLGFYPAGTVLDLTDGSTAVVCRSDGEAHWASPVVRPVLGTEGSVATVGPERDLSRDSAGTSVLSVIEPDALGPGLRGVCFGALARQTRTARATREWAN